MYTSLDGTKSDSLQIALSWDGCAVMWLICSEDTWSVRLVSHFLVSMAPGHVAWRIPEFCCLY